MCRADGWAGSRTLLRVRLSRTLRTARHHELPDEQLNDVAVLIVRLDPGRNDAAVGARPGWSDFHDLAMDTQRVARSRRLRPPDFSARTDQAAGNRHTALNQETHGERRRVPSARDQPAERGELRRRGIDVKGLWIELAGKADDLCLVDHE